MCFVHPFFFFSVAPLKCRFPVFFFWIGSPQLLPTLCVGLRVWVRTRGVGEAGCARDARGRAGQGGARRPRKPQNSVGQSLGGGGAGGKAGGGGWRGGGWVRGRPRGAAGPRGDRRRRGDGQTEAGCTRPTEADFRPSLPRVSHAGSVGLGSQTARPTKKNPLFSLAHNSLAPVSLRVCAPPCPTARSLPSPPLQPPTACAQGAPIEAAVVCGKERGRSAARARARAAAHTLAPDPCPSPADAAPPAPAAVAAVAVVAAGGGKRGRGRQTPPPPGSVCLWFAAALRLARVRAPAHSRRPSSAPDAGGQRWLAPPSRQGRGEEEEAAGGLGRGGARGCCESESKRPSHVSDARAPACARASVRQTKKTRPRSRAPPPVLP